MAQVAYTSNCVADLPFFPSPSTSSETMDLTIFPKEYDPLKIYSRALRKTRMEDLDDGTGRLVSGRQHLPRGPIAYTDTGRNKSIYDEYLGRLLNTTDANAPKRDARSTPSSHKAKKPCCDALVAQPATDLPPVASKVDIEMADSADAYMQYPTDWDLELQEEPPLAYLAFPDPAPQIKQQPYLGTLPTVNPWDVQMNLDPPTFRGKPLSMPHPSGMPGSTNEDAGKPVKKPVNPTKKRASPVVKKVRIVAPPKKAAAAEKKTAGRKKTTT